MSRTLEIFRAQSQCQAIPVTLSSSMDVPGDGSLGAESDDADDDLAVE